MPSQRDLHLQCHELWTWFLLCEQWLMRNYLSYRSGVPEREVSLHVNELSYRPDMRERSLHNPV